MSKVRHASWTVFCFAIFCPSSVFAADVKWPGAPLPFTYCKANSPPGALERIREAAEKWSYSKIRFVVAIEKCVPDAKWNSPDGISYISFESIVGESGRHNLAVANWRNAPGTANIVECDIRLNKDKHWFAKPSGSPGNSENDLISSVLHEFGHCLGLDHSKDSNSVMADKLESPHVRRELTKTDIESRDLLYGQP